MENNKSHILIVDDDNRIRDLLRDYLSENKYIVSTAENAEQAKERLKFLKFDIIILDVMMPGQNGYELTKEIKRLIKVPIILLTAKGEVENRIKGLEVPVMFLTNLISPLEPERLYVSLSRAKNRLYVVGLESKVEELKKGDYVIFEPRHAMRIAHKDIEYLMFPESSILAKINK